MKLLKFNVLQIIFSLIIFNICLSIEGNAQKSITVNVLDSIFAINKDDNKAYIEARKYIQSSGDLTNGLEYLEHRYSKIKDECLKAKFMLSSIPFYAQTNKIDTAITISNIIVNELIKCKNDSSLVIAYSNLGNLYLGLDAEMNLKYLIKSDSLISILKMNDRKIASSNNIAVALLNVGATDKAINYLNQSLEYIKKMGDEQDYGSYYTNLAKCFYNKGIDKYPLVLLYYEKADSFYQIKGNFIQKLQSKNNIATMYWKIGSYQKAIPLLREIENIYKDKEIDAKTTQISLLKSYYNISDYYNAKKYFYKL